MIRQHRSIILLIDNFSGHYIDYKPKNIRLEFFAPNMTSFVQPLDAGIIRCFKAYYRRAFCLRVEVMLMAKEAWASISAQTIENCWNHTQIQKGNRRSLPTRHLLPLFTLYKILLHGKSSKNLLGNAYQYEDWKPAYEAVFNAEEDTVAALTAVQALARTGTHQMLSLKSLRPKVSWR